MNNRRDFLKKTLIAAGSVPVAGAVLSSCVGGATGAGTGHSSGVDDKYRLIPKNAGLPVTGTFLDEITWDIPSQNWGYDKWDKDFDAMKKMGVDTVILIRGAFGRYMTFRSDVLMLIANRELTEKFNMDCWTNVESFDRDMPMKFLPIKSNKLRMKLDATKYNRYDKAITFEFSHFMSPQSAYRQAGNLYKLYCEHFMFPC
ncbi:MAG: DUF4434 domain-containing protein [Prevotellaceae bacterium]|jgi:hypothetical protein|nr:DUF4434 domain-containing protein [Prevotellaceae bacterium]